MLSDENICSSGSGFKGFLCFFFLGFKILCYIFVLQSLPKTQSLEGAPEKKKSLKLILELYNWPWWKAWLMDAEKGVGVDLADLINNFASLLCAFCFAVAISYLLIYY